MIPSNLSPADHQRLDDLYDRLRACSARNVGYPCNQDFDFSELFRFLQFSANNVGAPFHGTNYRLNTMEFEREVLTDLALAAVAMRLREAGLDLRSMHILRREASSTTASLVCSDNAMAPRCYETCLWWSPGAESNPVWVDHST